MSMDHESMKRPIGIIAALEREIAGLKEEMAGGGLRPEGRGKVVEGNISGRRVILVKSGIGPDRAERAARRLLEESDLEALLSIGYTGGVVDDLRTGDLVIADEVLSLDGMPSEKGLPPAVTGRLRSDRGLVDRARQAAEARSIRFRVGAMATLREPANTPALKRKIGEAFGVCSVEMESAAVAEAAAAVGVPFLAIRTVSDSLGRRLPSKEEIAFWTSKKRSPTLLLAALAHPACFTEMLILWRGLHVATVNLNRYIINFISKFGRIG